MYRCMCISRQRAQGIKELRFETAQRQWCVDYYGNYDIEVAIKCGGFGYKEDIKLQEG